MIILIIAVTSLSLFEEKACHPDGLSLLLRYAVSIGRWTGDEFRNNGKKNVYWPNEWILRFRNYSFGWP